MTRRPRRIDEDPKKGLDKGKLKKIKSIKKKVKEDQKKKKEFYEMLNKKIGGK